MKICQAYEVLFNEFSAQKKKILVSNEQGPFLSQKGNRLTLKNI